MLAVCDHPLLELRAFVTELMEPLGQSPSPAWLQDLLRLEAQSALARSEELRAAIRDMLRHGGYKPTGRGKPSSEYLLRAAEEGTLASINPLVDACNATSLHSGIPISVVDLDRASEPLRVDLATPETSYVFNPTGQIIDLSGLLCLFDAEGPCANAVKDAQRTKTSATTRRTLSVVWGHRAHAAALESATATYRQWVERACAANTRCA
jgi:DNA/RNA-binding domain of Phe-tRNA-synthetase-like protein